MAQTATMKIKEHPNEGRDGLFRIRSLVSGHSELGNFHHFCIQLCQTIQIKGLDIFRRVQCFRHCPLYRNVRLSPVDIFPVALA